MVPERRIENAKSASGFAARPQRLSSGTSRRSRPESLKAVSSLYTAHEKTLRGNTEGCVSGRRQGEANFSIHRQAFLLNLREWTGQGFHEGD
jgi:hypothetical protein